MTTSSDDPLGRLVATTDPVQATTLYTYSATEKQATMDAQGNVTSYGYDAAGRLLTTTDPLTGTVVSQYDAVGNTLTITSGSPGAALRVETRQYDVQNEVLTDTIGSPATVVQTTTTGYDADGNPTLTQATNGDVTLSEYDLAEQLRSINLLPASGTLVTPTQVLCEDDSVVYTGQQAQCDDAAGNVVYAVDADNRDHVSTYDGANREVRSIDKTFAVPGTTTITTTSSYDPDGNTISRTEQTSTPGQPVQTQTYTATVNAADWASSTQDNGLVTSYGYDGAGQRRSQTLLNNGQTPETRTLDAQGRAKVVV